MGRIVSITALAVAAAICFVANAQDAADAQKQRIEIQKLINQSRNQYRAKDYDAAAKSVADADGILVQFRELKVAGIARIVTNFDKQIDAMRNLLEGQGVKLAARATATPATGNTPTTKTPTPAGGGGTSFTKDVVPILVGKCRRCHMGGQTKGKFSMNSYPDLMRGADGAKVIQPGQGKDSRLYEVVASGDMPRGGGKLTAAELTTIAKWIDAGAKFDGPNQTAALTTLTNVTAAPAKTGPKLQVTKATGNEKISYSRDIAPVLAANCVGCHNARNDGGDLEMHTFTALLQGGDTGNVFIPGKGAESLIVMKLKGTAPQGQRMPRGRPPLADDVIAKFETWINEGAKFDGPEPAMSTQMVAAIYIAGTMSHDELAAQRLEKAGKNWALGNPDEKPEHVSTPNFNVIGNVIKSKLEEYGEAAERQHAEVAKYLGLPADQPLIKGKITLFVFARRYQYSEHGEMVEKRRPPSEWRTHTFYNVIDAYGCVPPPKAGDSTDSIIAEVIAASYLQSVGAPEWFAEGAGRAIAAKLDPKSEAVAEWKKEVSEAARQTNPVNLADNAVAIAIAPTLAYGFADGLLGSKSNFTKMVNAMKDGKSFDDAISAAYRQDVKGLLTGWSQVKR